MKLYEREWVAINYFCNKRYRKLFITEATKHGLNEGITDSLKKAWNSAKAKAESFLGSIAGAAKDLIPDGFLVGLSRFGAAKIIEFLAAWKAKKEKLKQLRQRFRLDEPLSPEALAHRKRKRELQRQP